ncbi:hypothetical protein [Streptomyces filamentosus]|uniref:hypothetical protein n=1 Tax=Streptomyces filamentosus TaxID=67294 RepID=UPI0033D8C371
MSRPFVLADLKPKVPERTRLPKKADAPVDPHSLLPRPPGSRKQETPEIIAKSLVKLAVWGWKRYQDPPVRAEEARLNEGVDAETERIRSSVPLLQQAFEEHLDNVWKYCHAPKTTPGKWDGAGMIEHHPMWSPIVPEEKVVGEEVDKITAAACEHVPEAGETVRASAEFVRVLLRTPPGTDPQAVTAARAGLQREMWLLHDRLRRRVFA